MDGTMELIMKLYDYMSDEEKESCCLQSATDMVADQQRYEIEHGWQPHTYDPVDFFETIQELIQQDADE